MPVCDFFESLDLSRSFDLTEAVESFIHDMETDTFRRWESVIREEQGLATMLVLIDLTAELLSFNDSDTEARSITSTILRGAANRGTRFSARSLRILRWRESAPRTCITTSG